MLKIDTFWFKIKKFSKQGPVLITDLLKGNSCVLDSCRSALLNLSKVQLVSDKTGSSIREGVKCESNRNCPLSTPLPRTLDEDFFRKFNGRSIGKKRNLFTKKWRFRSKTLFLRQFLMDFFFTERGITFPPIILEMLQERGGSPTP